MEFRIQQNTFAIDWNEIVAILQEVEMANYTPEKHKTAFLNSEAVVFIFDNEKLIGFGRAISDGAYQAAIYDVAVRNNFQGKGIGKLIVENLINQCPNCNIILYAAPGKELFYEKESFRKMKTGMARFLNSEKMRNNGFTE